MNVDDDERQQQEEEEDRGKQRRRDFRPILLVSDGEDDAAEDPAEAEARRIRKGKWRARTAANDESPTREQGRPPQRERPPRRRAAKTAAETVGLGGGRSRLTSNTTHSLNLGITRFLA